EPAVAAHLPTARAWVAALRTPLARLTISAAPGGVVLAGTTATRPTAADEEASARLLGRVPSVRGAIVAGGGTRQVVGDPTVRVELEPGLALEVPADVFTQVNPGANQQLIATVLALGGFTAGEHVIDLYCGAGNFTLPIARRGAGVIGVERDAEAIRAGEDNARRLGLTEARFERASAPAALGVRRDAPV